MSHTERIWNRYPFRRFDPVNKPWATDKDHVNPNVRKRKIRKNWRRKIRRNNKLGLDKNTCEFNPERETHTTYFW